ncbi:MAG TPA: glycine cleavage T C-terminal barrel domain-containing protein [Rhizomicrobium sp.]|nr:glycine cleavage T C-terminal barrel domain-containing protein [Rhizomicrobium sp.]
MTAIRATPFHGRASASNAMNLWQPRAGWTLAERYDDANEEALAARLTCAMADVTWRARVMIEGARAQEFLARLMTRDPTALEPGASVKALWLSDRGGLRGAGLLARHGRETFQLVSAASDLDWIVRGAGLFEVRVREVLEEEGMLAVVGPYAAKVLEAAGLDAALEPLRFRKLFWRGLDVTLSRFGEHGGYEIACKADDAPLVWDRIAKAGRAFALKPAGLAAMDILDLEAGVPRPGRDYTPASGGFDAAPTPFELGLESLIDEGHAIFNGRAAYLAAPRTTTRVGIEFDGDIPMPRAPLMRSGSEVGRTLNSLYSPALRRAIALAVVDTATAAPGTQLACGGTSARVTELPFLALS